MTAHKMQHHARTCAIYKADESEMNWPYPCDCGYQAERDATPAAPSQPVTLTDDDIARCINVATCGRPFIGLMNPGGVPSAFSRSLADLLIAALREKEQAK